MTKILVVDDEKNIRWILVQCLEEAGYEAISAIDGEQGLEKLKENPDLILLDMKLPGIDGLEVLRQARQQYPTLPVIMITAHGTIQTAVEAMKEGAVDYLQKPFTPEEIRAIVKRVLERQALPLEQEASSTQQALEQAKLLLSRRNFQTATQVLRRIIANSPDQPEAYNLLGAVQEIGNRLDEAAKMYRMALAVDPSYRPAIANLNRVTSWPVRVGAVDTGDSVSTPSSEKPEARD
jgi:CheY-like chemotaxis protein